MTDRILSCMLNFSRKKWYNYKQSKRKRNPRFQNRLKRIEISYRSSRSVQTCLFAAPPCLKLSNVLGSMNNGAPNSTIALPRNRCALK